MLKPLLLKFIGLCLSPFPIVLTILQAFKRGWSNVFYIKKRTVAPACLTDPRYGTSHYVQLKTGIKMHYVENGGGDPQKPLMVFLHGFPEFWFSWRHQLEYFSKDYWCVAPDLRGYNETSKPSGIENYSVDLIVDDIKSLIESLGRDRCVLVGHDWGGAIGYHFCGKYPEMATKYIVCNLPHPNSMREKMRGTFEQALKSWYILFFQCPYLPEMWISSFDLGMFDGLFAEMKESTTAEEIKEAYKYAYRNPETLTSAVNYYRHIMQYSDEEKMAKRVNDLKVPVLSIFGTGDRYLSVGAAKGGRKFVKDFTEHYIEGCSHWVQMERSDEVNKTMEKYLDARK